MNKTKKHSAPPQRQPKDLLRIILIAAALIIFAFLLYMVNTNQKNYYSDLYSKMEFETAEVLEVLEDNTTVNKNLENVLEGDMLLRIQILTGRYQNEIIEVTNYFTKIYNVYVTAGDKVSVRIDMLDEEQDEYSISIYNYQNKGILIFFVILFFIVMIIIGGKQGLKAILSLCFTLISIFFLLLPLILRGYSPIPTTIVLLVFATAVCFLILGGFQAKTISAALGCITGVVMAGILAVIFGNLTHVSGFQMDDAESLILVAADTNLKIRGLFISGVLIASLGAVMDIAMSISSSIEELHQNNPSMGPHKLFLSGMNIGRDAMGTMANTLILAFAGAALNMIVLMYSHGVSFEQLINSSFVALELIRSLAGSLGIVFTVPAVSFIGSRIIVKRDEGLSKGRRKNQKKNS